MIEQFNIGLLLNELRQYKKTGQYRRTIKLVFDKRGADVQSYTEGNTQKKTQSWPQWEVSGRVSRQETQLMSKLHAKK